MTGKLQVIGGGNMASSIIGGLIEQGLPAANIRASDPSQGSLQRLQQLAPICIATSNTDAVSGADVVILAVKPQVMKAVLAESFERIHRSNLVGMGVVPCEFINGETAESLGLTGRENFTITGIASDFVPGKILNVTADDKSFQVKARVDTPLEIEYLKNGGVLNYVLRNFMSEA